MGIYDAMKVLQNIENNKDIRLRDLTISGKFNLLPKGSIIMWFGKENDIPDGWAICNGKKVNSVETPDLRNRFIVGAGDDYSLKRTGGSNKVRLKTNEMPRHRHYINDMANNRSYYIGDGSYRRPEYRDYKNKKTYTNYEGGNKSHENRPPYYALYYIMRVK